MNDAHDRTHRLAQLYGIAPGLLDGLTRRRAALVLGENVAASPVAKLALLTLCNLTTRLGPYAPCLDLLVPGSVGRLASRVYPTGDSLEEQALWALRNGIALEGLVRNPVDVGHRYDHAIVIGDADVAATEVVHVSWSGWLGRVGSNPGAIDPNETNPFGALIGAALAAAALHARHLILMGARIPEPSEWVLNSYTLAAEAGGPDLRDHIELPRVLMVGAGALGSTLTYAMAHVPGVSGSVDTVDDDVLKRTNANRQITAPYDRAVPQTLPKVDDLHMVWPAIKPFRMKYDEYKSRTGRSAGDFDVAITAVDNTEARRAVATDLPRVVIDGATGGTMVAVMRGSIPTEACVACSYAEVATDDEDLWAKRLGASRETVAMLRSGAAEFDSAIINAIRERGTLAIDDEVVDGLRQEGWTYLTRARCGNAKPDRDLPSASVSYVSALCGFVMAAQLVAEVLGHPRLVGPPRWVWDDVLKCRPQDAERVAPDRSRSCSERHELRAAIHRGRWR